MKTKFSFFLNLLVLLNTLFLIFNCFAQWEPDVRLTTGSGISRTSFTNAWCVSASGANIHTVWFDDRDGNYEIYYKLSIDNGITWSSGTRLTNSSGYSDYPSVAVSNSNINIVWSDNRDGNYEIYFKNSLNGGLSWGTDKRLTTQSGSSIYPSITVQGSTVHVVWEDNRDGNSEIYYKKSTDGGTIWGADLRLTNSSGYSERPSISNSNSYIHVVWYDNRNGNYEIYYKHSTDGGINWGTEKRLTNNTANSKFPSIAATGSIVYVVWGDERDGNEEIYYIQSSDGGIIWNTETRLTNNLLESNYPSIAVSDTKVHIVWQNRRDGNNEIYYKRSTNLGLNWETDIRLTNNSAHSVLVSTAITGSTVNIIWTDYRNGNECIYYKRNPTGNVGIQNIGTEIPTSFSLEQNYPNPFNPSTKIRFSIPNSGFTTIKIFNILGKEISTLVNESLQPGTYETIFDGSGLNSGVYFYKFTTDGFSETKRMLLIK